MRNFALSLAAILAIGSSGCGRKTARAPLPAPLAKVKKGWSEDGIASWYGRPYHGRKAANGETYDMNKMTAAHKSLPFGVWVEVRNKKNERRVEVRITDRGPFIEGRIIDLSRAAAGKIGLIRPGIAPVRIRVTRLP
jgi:rare lipoprotein A